MKSHRLRSVLLFSQANPLMLWIVFYKVHSESNTPFSIESFSIDRVGNFL
ncbi:MAG TPA: hypothetical protein PKB02_09320 [Anaerohalosphaeraceae bacterium]|nr:hypothetical protein [Anaerohalosphaeraceae bacterium]